MREGPKLEFYVLNHDFNEKKIYHYNIFNNIRVYENVVRETRKYLRSPKKYKKVKFQFGDEPQVVLYGKEAYVDEIRSIVMWQEWSRCEYEISVGYAFEDDASKLEKWDCYKQFEPNKEMVCDYILAQYKKWQKEQKDNSAKK